MDKQSGHRPFDWQVSRTNQALFLSLRYSHQSSRFTSFSFSSPFCTFFLSSPFLFYFTGSLDSTSPRDRLFSEFACIQDQFWFPPDCSTKPAKLSRSSKSLHWYRCPRKRDFVPPYRRSFSSPFFYYCFGWGKFRGNFWYFLSKIFLQKFFRNSMLGAMNR